MGLPAAECGDGETLSGDLGDLCDLPFLVTRSSHTLPFFPLTSPDFSHLRSKALLDLCDPKRAISKLTVTELMIGPYPAWKENGEQVSESRLQEGKTWGKGGPSDLGTEESECHFSAGLGVACCLFSGCICLGRGSRLGK